MLEASKYKEILQDGLIPTIEVLNEKDDNVIFQDDSRINDYFKYFLH